MAKKSHRGDPEFTSLPSVFPELSDEEILAVADGTRSAISTARKHFDPYLIEIGRRGLYARRGCRNLRDFAFRTVGLGGKTLRGVASVWRGVQDKPALKELFVKGSVGWSKIRVVLSLATPETDTHWSHTVRSLPKSELETLVRGLKGQKKIDTAMLASAAKSAGINSTAGQATCIDSASLHTTARKTGRRPIASGKTGHRICTSGA